MICILSNSKYLYKVINHKKVDYVWYLKLLCIVKYPLNSVYFHA